MVDKAQISLLLVASPPPTERVTQLILRHFEIAGPSLSVRMGTVCHSQVITIDASLTGWGTAFEGRLACGIWTRAVRLIACNCHAHLVSKAGSVISSKSPSHAFRWSSIYYTEP